jgi:hypothetical protein
VQRTKSILRYDGGRSCSWSSPAAFSTAVDHTDIWYADPAGAEPGWALAVYDVVSGFHLTWFTYDRDGSPTWSYTFVENIYGDFNWTSFLRTTGTSYLAQRFDPASLTYKPVGGIYIEMLDNDRFRMIADGLLDRGWERTLTRYVYREGRTICAP